MGSREQNLTWLREQFRPLDPDEKQRLVHPVVVGSAVPLEDLGDDELEELVQGIKRFPKWFLVREPEDRESMEDH